MPVKKKSSKNKGKNSGLKDRELVFKEDHEQYAKVVAMLGDRRVTLILADGVEILGIIPGKMKRIRVNLDDVVLVGIRSFQDNKVDVLYLYTPAEVKNLIQYLELPPTFAKSGNDLIGAASITDDGIDFVEVIDFDDI